MNNLIPDKFDINGDLTLRFEKESLVLLAMTVVIVVVIGLLAAKFIR
jgi:hypothetical protein